MSKQFSPYNLSESMSKAIHEIVSTYDITGGGVTYAHPSVIRALGRRGIVSATYYFDTNAHDDSELTATCILTDDALLWYETEIAAARPLSVERPPYRTHYITAMPVMTAGATKPDKKEVFAVMLQCDASAGECRAKIYRNAPDLNGFDLTRTYKGLTAERFAKLMLALEMSADVMKDYCRSDEDGYTVKYIRMA